MITGKPNIEWYLKAHTEIVEREMEQARKSPRVHALLFEREPWEDWLRDANKEAWCTYQRLRARANELWTEGSENPEKQAQFILAVQTEYRLARWAIMEFLKFQEKAQALKNVQIKELWNAGNTRYE